MKPAATAWEVKAWGEAPGDFPEFVPDTVHVRAEDWKSAGQMAIRKLGQYYGRVVIRSVVQLSDEPPRL